MTFDPDGLRRTRESFAQCELRSDRTLQVAWIPARLAVTGRTIGIRNLQANCWEPWVVERVFSVQFRDLLPDSHSQIRNHRRHTGDALPKKKRTASSG